MFLDINLNIIKQLSILTDQPLSHGRDFLFLWPPSLLMTFYSPDQNLIKVILVKMSSKFSTKCKTPVLYTGRVNDLVRNLSLKEKTQMHGSRLKEKHILEPGTFTYH